MLRSKIGKSRYLHPKWIFFVHTWSGCSTRVYSKSWKFEHKRTTLTLIFRIFFGSVTFFGFFLNNVSGRFPKSRFSIHENWPISAPRWSWKLIFGYVGGIYVCFEYFRWKIFLTIFWWKKSDLKMLKPDFGRNLTWQKSVRWKCVSWENVFLWIRV